MKRSNDGFTLIEVLVAVAIMTMAFGAILLIQSNSLISTEKSRELNTVAMLARNAMIEAEMDVQGKSLTELKKEESKAFEPPFENYTWTRTVKEVELPYDALFSAAAGITGDGEGSGEGASSEQERVGKLVNQYLSKALRELTVTVSWPISEGKLKKYSVSTYIVDLNAQFSLSEQ